MSEGEFEEYPYEDSDDYDERVRVWQLTTTAADIQRTDLRARITSESLRKQVLYKLNGHSLRELPPI